MGSGRIRTIREGGTEGGGPLVSIVDSWSIRIEVDGKQEGGGGQTSEQVGADREREERESGRVGFPRTRRFQTFHESGGSDGGSLVGGVARVERNVRKGE